MPIKINGTNTAANPSITGDDTDTGIVYSSDQIDFSTGGSSKVTLNGSNLGIGTSIPSTILHCASTSNTGIFAQTTNSGSSASTNYQTPNRIFYSGIDIGGANSSYTIYDGTASAERMRINSDGNVGIGTTSPDTKLTVATSSGDAFIRATGGTNQGLLLNKSDGTLIGAFASGGTLGGGVSDIGLRAESGNNILFSHGTTERSRITSNGHLLVGTTSENVNSSSFGIVLDSNGSGHFFRNVDGGHETFRAGGTQGLTVIYGDGDIKNTNNSYGSLSDETLKQDIVDAASQWDDIKNLKVRKFRFKDNPTGVLQIGVIAQEIEKVSAGLVQEDDEGIKSVKYSVLYMKAVKCLQEAIAKIETLETKNAKLQTDLTSLTARVVALEAA